MFTAKDVAQSRKPKQAWRCGFCVAAGVPCPRGFPPVCAHSLWIKLCKT
ncbi:hypothetical protein VITFI_CDS0207 [Vitreoscilla filiformis]|uniref:Uncharacterized protein n=1 Tax=Vitreoscilla filiformis TaxID=63 RepID=A0A221KAF3_VITFI|nr:hypothetical protein VITFI_CDS0207 [Vitreoscilla filiformis]